MAEQVVDIRERIERMRTQITDKPDQDNLNKNVIKSSEKKTNIKKTNNEKDLGTESNQPRQRNDLFVEGNNERLKNTTVISAERNLKNTTEVSEEKNFKKTIEKQPLSTSSPFEDVTQDFSSKYNTKKKEYHSKTFKDYHVNNLVDENKKNINLENKNQPFPQFSLNVNNPISWKLMLLIMLMQLMTNIMLVVVLYLK